jgi:UDP-N-acetylglucosamine 2-epimerase (non-hydrolysing)
VHPRTSRMLREFGIAPEKSNGLHIVEPIGYHDSLCLGENARLVLTDSGGLQEETTFFRTPCLTLRPNTERPVTLSFGSNRLTSVRDLHQNLQLILEQDNRLGKVPPLWDGHTAERVLNALLE